MDDDFDVIISLPPPLQISFIPPMTLKEKVLANNVVIFYIFYSKNYFKLHTCFCINHLYPFVCIQERPNYVYVLFYRYSAELWMTALKDLNALWKRLEIIKTNIIQRMKKIAIH